VRSCDLLRSRGVIEPPIEDGPRDLNFSKLENVISVLDGKERASKTNIGGREC
jgi:hypothetical protein